MKIINLTGDVIKLDNTASQGYIEIPPNGDKLILDTQIKMRECIGVRGILKINAHTNDPLGYTFKRVGAIIINNLPPKMPGTMYLVSYETQYIIRTFSERTDFFTFIDGKIIDIRTEKSTHGKKRTSRKNTQHIASK